MTKVLRLMNDPHHGVHTIRLLLRWIAAIFFIGAGINHFLKPEFYQQIIPPSFPDRPILVVVSGIGEIAGGLGLLIRPLRRAAGWGLILLLCAVFPANVYMAISPQSTPGRNYPHWALRARLPLQAVIITWVWFVGVSRGVTNRKSA
jgi:uncharacterized membrane protein